MPPTTCGLTHLGNIAGCPTLILCGREDVFTPVEVHEELAAAIPGSRLVVIDERSHLSTMGQPKLVSAAMRVWLRGIKDRATAKVLPFRPGAAQDSPSSNIAPAEATASSG